MTEEKFRERNLHRKTVENLASKIKLMQGTEETFQELQKRDIKIYIVSGSILLVIRSVIGDLYKYVDGIKANQFRFNQGGFLTEIVGTKYDFEGKAAFITEIALELMSHRKIYCLSEILLMIDLRIYREHGHFVSIPNSQILLTGQYGMTVYRLVRI